MKPLDIYTYYFGNAGPHPAVIAAHPNWVSRAERLYLVFCTTQRTKRPFKEIEIRLEGTDGRDWETLSRCEILWLVRRSKLRNKQGSVPAICKGKINARNDCNSV